MKNLKTIFAAGISLFSISAFAAIDDYYYVGGSAMNPHLTGSWKDGTAPDGGGNWIFDGTYVNPTGTTKNSIVFWSDRDGRTGNQTPNVWNIDKIEFKSNLTAANWGSNSTFSFKLQRSGSTSTSYNLSTLTIGSFEKYCKLNIQIQPTYSNYSAGYDYALNITGDVTCTSNESLSGATFTTTYFGGWNNGTSNNSSSVMFREVTIGGLVTIGYTERISFMAGKVSTTPESMNYLVGDVNLNGGVKMYDNSTLALQNSDEAYNAVIRVNGINGKGFIKNNADKDGVVSGTKYSMLVFTNTSNASFDGNICDVSTSYDFSSLVKTKLVMAGSNGVTQTVKGTQYFSGGVEVISGNLRFDNASSYTLGDLTMRGGSFGANNEGSGMATFHNGTYYGGTLFFSINGDSADYLEFWGTFTKDISASKIILDFDLTNITEGRSYNLMYWDSYSGFSEDDFEFISSEYVATFAVSNMDLSVSFLAIPEASTFATILGLVSLVAVAMRRIRQKN